MLDISTVVTGKGKRAGKSPLSAGTREPGRPGTAAACVVRMSSPAITTKGASQTSQPRPANHRLLFLIIYGSQIAVSVIRTIIWFNNSDNRIIV